MFHKGSVWRLRNGEYNCSKCISFLAIKQASHVHLGDGKRKKGTAREGKCRQKGDWRGRNYEASSPATLHSFLYSIYAYLWTRLVENCIFGNLVPPPLMHFLVLVLSLCWQSQGKRGEESGKAKTEQTKNKGGKAAVSYSPVTWSTRMREVIMRPYWEKSCSSSFWVIVFGRPLTYKFASLMEAELGRA